MKQLAILFALACVAPMASGAQTTTASPPVKVSMAAATQRNYGTVKRFLTAAAEKMVEGDYAFRPTPAVRSFGEAIAHVAQAQFATCARAKGEANPKAGVEFEKESAKATAMKNLSDSFTYCDDAYETLTDERAAEFIKGATSETARGALLANNVIHSNEMYGTIAVYMRLRGLVPPTTEAAQAQRRP